MFLILNSSNLIVDISKNAHYVWRQHNGVLIRSNAEQADAIYSANSGKFYPIRRAGHHADSHSFIEVNEVPTDIVPGYYYYDYLPL